MYVKSVEAQSPPVGEEVRGGYQLRCRPRHLAVVKTDEFCTYLGRGSQVVMVLDRGWPCHEFEPSTTKDPPYFLILNHGQTTRTAPELKPPPSSIYITTSTGLGASTDITCISLSARQVFSAIRARAPDMKLANGMM
ncbi:hypothetical protein TNCV_3632351 [Trichonephila clavipes]|nr:hypothetical protein TNCV_3632351 [Trichonephila clavipes]